MNNLRNITLDGNKSMLVRKFEQADKYLDAYLDKKITYEDMKAKILKLELK